MTTEEKEKFFERTASTPCPNLSESGECLMYEHRPLVCRTFGLKRITLPTLIDFLAWIGWSAGLRDTGKA